MADLEGVEEWVGVLLERLQPSERSKLTRKLATELRRSQQQRIVAQRNPGGTAFAPRKPRKLRSKVGRVKRQKKMFTKLRTARFLKVHSDANAIVLGFTGRIAKIARVHQYGLRDRAERGAKDTKYHRRELLGATEADREKIRDSLLAHLT